MDLAAKLLYYSALGQAAPPGSILRAGVRKAARAVAKAARRGRVSRPEPEAIARAAEALGQAINPFDSRGAGEAGDEARRRLYFVELCGSVEHVLRAGRRAAAGEVEVFGRSTQLGWHDDPLSGRSFDVKPQPALRLDEEDGRDPKGPWEIGRMAHLLALGRAARLVPASAPSMREAFVCQVRDFAARNPLGMGLAWCSPLELSIRAIHLLAAFHLLGGRAKLGAEPTALLAELLLAHGRFIEQGLEDTGVVAGSHLVGNLVALLWLGTALSHGGWQGLAARGLAEQARHQVYPDGAGFEGSTDYHRFTLELLLAAAFVSRALRLPLSAPFWSRLRGMFHFVKGYLAPDGSEPCLGDADDSRVLPFGERQPREHAYLLPTGAMLFGDPELKVRGIPFSEEALWVGGAAGYERWRRLPWAAEACSRAFVHGGLYVMRQGTDYLAVRCGPAGQDGIGGHSHNDQLAIVAYGARGPVVQDPGTGCYALDPVLRDRLRGTAAHGTLVVDGQEQSPIPPRLFALPDRTRARVEHFSSSPLEDRFIGRHRGYERLGSRLTHRREVRFDKGLRVFVLQDFLAGAGCHDVEIRFPLPSREARCELGDEARRRVGGLEQTAEWARAGFDVQVGVEVGPRERPVAIIVALRGQGLRLELLPAVRAPRYGKLEPTFCACFSRRTRLPCQLTIALVMLGESTRETRS